MERHNIFQFAILLADEFQENDSRALFDTAFSKKDSAYYWAKLNECKADLTPLSGALKFLLSYLDDKNFALLTKAYKNHLAKLYA